MIVSVSKPLISKEQLFKIFPDLRLFNQSFLFGVRNYRGIESIGYKNQRAVYDDAIFVIGQYGEFKGFAANTDPTEHKTGRAVLQPGLYQYQIGFHNRNLQPPRKHKALIQAGPVNVLRDGQAFVERGFFGINIHRGGRLSTGSEGCQTIPADQWNEFIDTVHVDIMERYNMRFIYYKLVEHKEIQNAPV